MKHTPSPSAVTELAQAMPDGDLVDAVTVLGPDSPLLPAVREEIRVRLRQAAATDV